MQPWAWLHLNAMSGRFDGALLSIAGACDLNLALKLNNLCLICVTASCHIIH